jgi:hypothetical protein
LIARVTIAAVALAALGILCVSCGGGEDSGDPPGAGATAPTRTGETARGEPASPRPVAPATGERERTGGRKSSRRVRRDTYKAGRQTCFIFGIDQIRRKYELVQRSPEPVARFHANLFEKANPELIAPYYQGCLRGLRERAQRDRRLSER